MILISNSHDFDHWIHIVSTVDRFTRFVAPPDAPGDNMLRGVALSSGVMIAASRKVRLSAEDNALARGLVTLGQGYMLGLSLAKEFAADTVPAPANICSANCGAKSVLPSCPSTAASSRHIPKHCGTQSFTPTSSSAIRFRRIRRSKRFAQQSQRWA